MEKVPIDLFISDQLKLDRYKSIITQLSVDPLIVHMALVTYFKDQGVFMVSASLGRQLSDKLVRDFETNEGIARAIHAKVNIAQKR
ncbi:MAG: hypothetical protein NT027_12270 [Proteobacteria bacterium]|nr:hypothetical protein [Pseudomonadota bacterium]